MEGGGRYPGVSRIIKIFLTFPWDQGERSGLEFKVRKKPFANTAKKPNPSQGLGNGPFYALVAIQEQRLNKVTNDGPGMKIKPGFPLPAMLPRSDLEQGGENLKRDLWKRWRGSNRN